ncbi:MAG: SDR family oxidoreductase [Ruminococcus sp.]|nr:SDR family oxidoreductase [Ruminococcus sp.]
MVNVKNRWALVTGSSRGIGRLVSLFLAEQGCNLILHSRKPEHTESLLSEVRALGVEAYAVSAEFSKPEEVEAMLREIDGRGTPVDLILNNAGLQIAYRTDYYKTPVSDYTESFLINTVSPIMICYHFLPKMIECGFGRILNTTSGIRLEPEQAGYSASKAALDKVTIDLGSKLNGTDVMINLTDPGWCRTDLGGHHAPNAPESAIPGAVVGVFVDDKKSGRYLGAQNFAGMTLEEAVRKAEAEFDSPY